MMNVFLNLCSTPSIYIVEHRTEELEKKKERRRHAEEEEERMFREIEQRRREEKKDLVSKPKRTASTPSPTPPKDVDSDFELEKDISSNIFEVKEIEASPPELEPLREDSHSDISEDEEEKKNDESDQGSSSSSSSSAESVSAVSSDSSSSEEEEEEGEVEHEASNRSRKRNGINNNNGAGSNNDADPNIDDIPSKKRKKESSPGESVAPVEDSSCIIGSGCSPNNEKVSDVDKSGQVDIIFFTGLKQGLNSNLMVFFFLLLKNRKPNEVVVVEEVKNELDLLPQYFPALQGCRRVEEYSLLNRIEEGTYGVVYRASDKRNNEIVALKRLKMEKEKDGFPITSLREINTLLKVTKIDKS